MMPSPGRFCRSLLWLALALVVSISASFRSGAPGDVAAFADPPAEPPVPGSLKADAAAKWQGEYPALPIKSISREAFEGEWQIDVAVDQMPLEKVLRQLIAPVESWDVKIVPHPGLSKKISLDLKQVSRLEAIEQACRAADLHPVYRDGRREQDTDPREIEGLVNETGGLNEQVSLSALQQFLAGQQKNRQALLELVSGKYPAVEGLEDLEQPYPSVAFAGPVRVQLLSLREDVPHAAGEIKLRFLWLPIPGHVGPDRNHEPAEMPWKVASIESSAGSDLMVPNGGYSSYGRSYAQLLDWERTLSLKGLLRDVDRIGSLNWRLHFKLPVKWTPLWLENPASGDRVKEGPFEVTYGGNLFPAETLGFNFNMSHRLAKRGVGKPTQLRIFAFDAEGGNLESGVSLMDLPGSTSGVGRSLHFDEPPALFAVVPITEAIDVVYEQSFSDIPLPQHEKQPKALEKLDFGDREAPVEVEFLGRSEKADNTLRVKLTNHSNKDIHEVQVSVTEVDEEGEPTRRGDSYLYFGFDSGFSDGFQRTKQTLAAGKTVVGERAPYNPPPADALLNFQVKRVVFVDKTEWKLKARRAMFPGLPPQPPLPGFHGR